MERGSTLILKAVLVLIGLAALGVCIFALPVALRSDVTGYYGPIAIGMYVAAVPFFIAIYWSLKLLGYIDKNRVFSQASVNALKHIKYCAIANTALYIVGMPYIFHVADKDDAPGVAAIGFVIIFASFVIATATAVAQRLLQNAVDIKSENDLTV